MTPSKPSSNVLSQFPGLCMTLIMWSLFCSIHRNGLAPSACCAACSGRSSWHSCALTRPLSAAKFGRRQEQHSQPVCTSRPTTRTRTLLLLRLSLSILTSLFTVDKRVYARSSYCQSGRDRLAGRSRHVASRLSCALATGIETHPESVMTAERC
jgi:hypothetical protein